MTAGAQLRMGRPAAVRFAAEAAGVRPIDDVDAQAAQKQRLSRPKGGALVRVADEPELRP